MTDAPQSLDCSHAQLRQPHGTHSWEPQPGMNPVRCEGWGPLPPARPRITARPVSAEEERAAMERVRQHQADSAKAAAWIAANSGGSTEKAEAVLGRVLAELDRIAQLGTVTSDDGRANTFAVGARWTLRMIREVIDGKRDPAAPTEADPQVTGTDDDYCGSDPPQRADDPDSQWGDCWCTLPTGHDGPCRCETCTERHGAPGWDENGAAAIDRSQP